MDDSRILSEKKVPSENLTRWWVSFGYRRKESWDIDLNPLQCYVLSEKQPGRHQAHKAALKAAADWTGFPERRLMVEVYAVEVAIND